MCGSIYGYKKKKKKGGVDGPKTEFYLFLLKYSNQKNLLIVLCINKFKNKIYSRIKYYIHNSQKYL